MRKNFELDQQLSVKAFFVQDLFEKVYLGGVHNLRLQAEVGGWLADCKWL